MTKKIRNSAIKAQVKIDMVMPRGQMEDGKGNDNLYYVVSNLGLFARPLREVIRLVGI